MFSQGFEFYPEMRGFWLQQIVSAHDFVSKRVKVMHLVLLGWVGRLGKLGRGLFGGLDIFILGEIAIAIIGDLGVLVGLDEAA